MRPRNHPDLVDNHFITITKITFLTTSLLVEAVAMTGSDLCASSKPWDLQMQTVATIYEEFYKQV